MAYTFPTLDEFKARFPSLTDGKEDAFLQFFLDEAANVVDTSWRESDYKTAIMYLAAHLLASEEGAGGDAGAGVTGSGVIASESFGGMSISYDNSKSAGDAAANSQWGATVYGRRFYQMLKLNKPSIVSI
jgi:hypothetical protein